MKWWDDNLKQTTKFKAIANEPIILKSKTVS